MNYNCKNTKDNNLYVAEDDGLVFDYEEIAKGIEASREDFKNGRYTDVKTSMAITRRMLFGE